MLIYFKFWIIVKKIAAIAMSCVFSRRGTKPLASVFIMEERREMPPCQTDPSSTLRFRISVQAQENQHRRKRESLQHERKHLCTQLFYRQCMPTFKPDK
jgi:hypothetical protein